MTLRLQQTAWLRNHASAFSTRTVPSPASRARDNSQPCSCHLPLAPSTLHANAQQLPSCSVPSHKNRTFYRTLQDALRRPLTNSWDRFEARSEEHTSELQS